MQIVGYDAADGGLSVSTADGSAVSADDLIYQPLDPGTELEYTLGERHCAGTIHDGKHYPCDNQHAPYCSDHQQTWVCAICTGTCLKDEMDCFDEHAVYLAAFAPETFKVGVTKRWRLETRLREQGADRGAHIRTVANGRIARELEAEIAETIPDRIRVPTKQAGLGQSVDMAAWDDLCDSFEPIEQFEFEYGLRLDSQPVPETIATGTVRGTKGRLVILDRGGTTYAVDMRALVGYEVTEEPSSRTLQSSFGSFG